MSRLSSKRTNLSKTFFVRIKIWSMHFSIQGFAKATAVVALPGG